MMYQKEQTALAERLQGMEPGEKRDNVLLLYGFAAGIQAREGVNDQEAQSA